MHDGEYQAALFGRLDHLVSRANRDADGLLGEDVQARLESGDCDRWVEVVRSRDGNRVAKPATDERFVIVERRDAVFGGFLVRDGVVRIAHRHEFGLFDVLRDALAVAGAHAANADHADSHRFH